MRTSFFDLDFEKALDKRWGASYNNLLYIKKEDRK